MCRKSRREYSTMKKAEDDTGNSSQVQTTKAPTRYVKNKASLAAAKKTKDEGDEQDGDAALFKEFRKFLERAKAGSNKSITIVVKAKADEATLKQATYQR